MTVVTVAVVTVVIVEKTTWHLDNRWDVLGAAFRDSRDVCFCCSIKKEKGVHFFKLGGVKTALFGESVIWNLCA